MVTATASTAMLPTRDRSRARRDPSRRRPLPVVLTPIRAPRAGLLERMPPALLLACLAAASAVMHLAMVRIAGLRGSRRPPSEKRDTIRVVVRDKPLPPPVAPPPPEPEPPKVVKAVRNHPAPKTLAQPVPQPPPPPESPPPVAEPAPGKPPPLLVPGMALSATSEGGSFAVPVGNTLFGKPGAGSARAPTAGGGGGLDGPEAIKPAYALSEEPVFLDNVSAAEMRRYYPEEARKTRTEGVVTVNLTIDATGRVIRVSITDDPGHGFAAAARTLARAYRFKPARINGRAVATEIPFTVRFVLDE